MSKITIIEPNTSDKDQIRNYLVKGERGDDGVSPTVETSKTGDTATITITDVEGEHEVELKDGVSPTVETSKSGKVTTVTITDAEGTHTATINDGEDGATTNIINSETLTDKTTQTYSANIVDTLLGDKADASDISDLENTKFAKDNITSLSTTVTVANGSVQNSSIISLPTGFTRTNSFVIGYKFSSSDEAYDNEADQRRVQMGSGNISVNPEIKYWTSSSLYVGFTQPSTQATTTYTITILLMKVS